MNRRCSTTVRSGSDGIVRSLACVFCFMTTPPEVLLANQRTSPEKQEIHSDNQAYLFAVTPTFGGNNSYQHGKCRGALYAVDAREPKLRWERPLINNVSPITACVSNSGRYVVTFGEWYNYQELPIALYGPNGTLISVFGAFEQLIPYRVGHTDDGQVSLARLGHWLGEFPHSIGGYDWIRHSMFFFDRNEDFFAVRLSNREILVFETRAGRLVDDVWIEIHRTTMLDEGRKYHAFKADLDRLIVLKALRLASSDVPREREDGLFVLNQCKERDSISVLEQSLKDPTSKIVNTKQGRMREYPIRKAAKEALKAMGGKVPENVVTEEKVETKE